MSSTTVDAREIKSGKGFGAVESSVTAVGGAGDVVDDFAAAAHRWPDRAALIHNGTAIGYRQLAERISSAATWLAEHQARSGTSALVGVSVTHTPMAVESLLAILQAGAAYCPIDDALPAARKAELAAVLGVAEIHAGVCGTDVPSGNSRPLVNARYNESRPEDPAYVLCTSGSTGMPKPVVISRYALSVTVRALRTLFGLTPADRVLQFASLGWDTCLEEILPALISGAAVVFDDAAHSGSFPRFLRMLSQRGITVLDLPTAFWHELVLFLLEENATLPECVRLVVIGGERVDGTRMRQWRDLDVRHIKLLNTYGCTETTMITHAVQLDGPGAEPELAAPDAETPLGRALPHVCDHLTDDGELLVSGPAVASGYLGLPDFTEASFPVADHGGGPVRWFRTGDLVCRGDNGLLYSRGRADEQVKVLGVRVHPAEVEAQLTTHPAVAGAVVVGQRRLEQATLTAYVVASGPATEADLKRYLSERLPGQFVPSRVKFVAALAYTPTGKVDRTATILAAVDNDSEGAGR